jgi:serine O-acetyltransferase
VITDTGKDWARLRHDTLYNALIQVIGNNGYHAVLIYRFANWLYVKRIPALPQLLTSMALCLTGAEISPQARIGAGLVIKHPGGIVVGAGAIIGCECTILQNATVGEKLDGGGDHSYPTIGNRVTICAGAVILGGVTIGDGATIGANAVVLDDVPPGTTAVGAPARIVTSRQAPIFGRMPR